MNSRRSFLKNIGSFLALASMPVGTALASSNRIIIVGGGVAGTRAAAYLKMSLPFASVMLLDPALKNANENNYFAIQNKHKPVTKVVLDEIGVDIIADKVLQLEPAEKSVRLINGKKYNADFLVVAPGVDFKWNNMAGIKPDLERMVLHAWQHPSKEVSLWQQIQSMRDGDSVVISVPLAPYRFPQGPYQRATRIAEYIKIFKPRSKVLVLDSNNEFPSMHQYLEQWSNMYPQGMVEWVSAASGGGLEQVDIQKNRVYTSAGWFKAGVLNLIPPQQAGLVSREAGLNSNSDWCQVVPHTLESAHYKNVYVIGDANDAKSYKKTAAVAEQHALQCAKNIQTLIS